MLDRANWLPWASAKWTKPTLAGSLRGQASIREGRGTTKVPVIGIVDRGGGLSLARWKNWKLSACRLTNLSLNMWTLQRLKLIN